MSEDPDLSGLLQQAMALQQQLAAAQEEAASAEVEGRAGGGAVRVTMTGAGEVRKVRIDPEVVDPSEVDLLEDLVLAALHDAAAKASELQASALGGLGGLGGLDLGGLGDLGALGDLGGLGLGELGRGDAGDAGEGGGRGSPGSG